MTYESLMRGIAVVKPGATFGDIGFVYRFDIKGIDKGVVTLIGQGLSLRDRIQFERG